MIGERVEGRLDIVLVRDYAGIRAQCCQKRTAEGVARKQPVQIAAGNQPIGADAAIRAACQAQHGAIQARSGGLSNVHFVAPNRHPGRQLDPGGLCEAFGAGQNGLDVEETEPGYGVFAPLHTERIGNAAAEHLISAANAEDSSALAAMREEVDVPPFAPQGFEIGDRRLRARKNDKRGVARQRLPWPDHDNLNVWLRMEWIEIVEIGDARQQWDRDPDRPPALTRLPFPPPQAGEG